MVAIDCPRRATGRSKASAVYTGDTLSCDPVSHSLGLRVPHLRDHGKTGKGSAVSVRPDRLRVGSTLAQPIHLAFPRDN